MGKDESDDSSWVEAAQWLDQYERGGKSMNKYVDWLRKM